MEQGLTDPVQHEGFQMRECRGQPPEGLLRHGAVGDPANAVLFHAHPALEIAPRRHLDEKLGRMCSRRHGCMLSRRPHSAMTPVICRSPGQQGRGLVFRHTGEVWYNLAMKVKVKL